MDKILEYVLANYTWILGGVIIILLAIIGSYADKTNFGQGKIKAEPEEDKNKDFVLTDEMKDQINKRFNESIAGDSSSENEEQNKIQEEVTNHTSNILDKNISEEKETAPSHKGTFDDKFEKMSQEVEEYLPEKELIDGDLLDEIENLSLDKTQKINTNEIPDLDDVELPKIKDLKSESDDVWKF